MILNHQDIQTAIPTRYYFLLRQKYLVGIMFKLIPTRYSNVVLNSIPFVSHRYHIGITLKVIFVKGLGILVFLYFFLHFNFAYHTNKALYNKSLQQARIR